MSLTDADQEEVSKLLTGLYPRAFKPRNLDWYLRQLSTFDVDEVCDAVSRWNGNANNKGKPPMNWLLLQLQGHGADANTGKPGSPDSTGNTYADSIRASMTPVKRKEVRGFNAAQIFVYHFRDWYRVRVLQHRRSTERSRSATEAPAAGLAVANAQLLHETQKLFRDAAREFMAQLELSHVDAEALARLTLGETSDYEHALKIARRGGSVTAYDEPGDPESMF